MIVSAAIKIWFDPLYQEFEIIPVHRHKDFKYWESFFKMYGDHLEAWGKVDGFLTDDGRFLDRRRAADHAYECGQLIEDAETERIEVLMSEDLW